MVEYEKATSTYTLKIEKVQETDGAIYQVPVYIMLSFIENHIYQMMKKNTFNNINYNENRYF